MEPNKKFPRLDRVYLDIPNSFKSQILPAEQRMQKMYYGVGNTMFGTPEERTLRDAIKSPNVYFDAGWLPEVVIRPPKDNAVYKAKYMVRDKDFRLKFYEDLQEYEDMDTRLYINRLWELYNKSQRPMIRPTQSKSNFFVPIYQKITGGDINRPNYNVLTNSMNVNPEFVISGIEAELSHAYLVYGTDTPRSLNWIKLFFTLPGDIKINGRNGYNRIGNKEFVAHSIIEPIFHDYLTNPRVLYQDVYDSILDIYNDQENFFKPIDRGPFSGSTVPINKISNLPSSKKK